MSSISLPKVIVFVHTCLQYENSRARVLERSWASRDNVVFITDSENSKLKRRHNLGPYKEGPTYHSETVERMFSLYLESYADRYPWLMIVDDDSYVWLDKLERWLSFFSPSIAYWMGDFLNWIAPRTEDSFTCDYMRWPGGGPGLLFTRSAVDAFLTLSVNDKVSRSVNHDVWLHFLYMCSDKRIQRVHCPGFHQYGLREIERIASDDTFTDIHTDMRVISLHLEHEIELVMAIDDCLSKSKGKKIELKISRDIV